MTKARRRARQRQSPWQKGATKKVSRDSHRAVRAGQATRWHKDLSDSSSGRKPRKAPSCSAARSLCAAQRERAPNACCSVRRKLLSFCHWPPSKLTAACACGLVVHGNSCRCQEIIDWSMKQNLNIYPTVHLKPIPFAKLSWLCMMSKSHFPVSIRESAPISFDGFLLKERRGFHKIWRIWQNQLAEYLLRPCSCILPL